MAKLLVIEDNLQVCEMIRDRMEHERYIVETVHTGTDGIDRLLCCQYDVVILDWELPGANGLEVLKRFRQSGGKTPVIMLTGKAHDDDKESGLDTGADDYLTKPFSARELSARLRALLRRHGELPAGPIKIGDLELDRKGGKLQKAGVEIPLQPAEYSLLEFLMRHPGQLFSPDDLINRAWHSESEATANSIRIAVTRLRKKIDREGEPSVITTVSRMGYRFEAQT
jgi:DNA-binding response OmpR family regulator